MPTKKKPAPAVQQVIQDSKQVHDTLMEKFTETQDLRTAELALAAGRNVISGARVLIQYKEVTGEDVDFTQILK